LLHRERERDNRARESWKIAFGVGLYMVEPDSPLAGWETQAQVDACLAETGATQNQVNRWRHLGLLPEVAQDPATYRGSTVRYPPGTCAQIKAAARLFKEKNRASFVGRMLWWEGYPVDDQYWRPELAQLASRLDRVRRLIDPLIERYSRSETDETLQERLARATIADTVFSRIQRRLQFDDLSALFSVLLTTAEGGFSGFRPGIDEERETSDETIAIKAFDLGRADRDQILGKRFKFREALGPALKNIALALKSYSFSSVLLEDPKVVFAARDDVRHTLDLARYFYNAVEWIFGPRAFGLRLAAWIAEKKPAPLVGGMILGLAVLRKKMPEAILSSDEIARLALQAKEIHRVSGRLKDLWQTDPRFHELLRPKRIRAGFVDKPSLRRWLRQIEAVRGRR
jgi:hypothetical protein